MYLPEATIREILLKNGYNSHNLCFLSNTFFKCKRTGSLFKLIQKKVDVDYKQILHIGDNKTSDVEIPKKLGILTYYYPKVSESLTKSHCFIKQYLKEISSLDEKLFLGAIALGYHRFKTQNKNNESYWADLGYLFGGMLSYGFLNWLDEVCRQKNITQLLFVARDGYSLNSLFKQVSDISSLYVYAPRAVSTCINQSFRIDIKQGDDLKRDREISIINKVASFYGIGITGNLSDLSFRKRFIQTNTCYFEDFCKLIKGNYQNYINSLPLVGDEIGVVDSITGSFSAQQLIQKSLPAKNVFGFYVHKLSKGNERCFEFCKEDRKIEFCHFVELLFSSPEKPIEIILNNSPQYQKNINSLEQFKIDIYPEIQKGMTEAFLFLNEFKPRISDKCWYNWFHSFYKKPSEVDKFYLAKCQNGIDEAHTRYEPIFSKWYIRSRKIKEYYLFGIKVYRKEKN